MNAPSSHASRADVAQLVVRLPFLAEGGGSTPTHRLHFTSGTVKEANALLAGAHYLGPASGGAAALLGYADDVLVAAQVYRWPAARMLASDGTWLELSRWCLTPAAGENAGSRMMGWARRWLRHNLPTVTTLVSYSDPSVGHTGTLYRASGWVEAPTHHTLRLRANGVGYPSGHGSWDGATQQSPKERWVLHLEAAA